MKVSFEGMGEQVVTFEAETSGSGAVAAGKPVVVSANGKVSAASKSGDVPAGVAVSVRGDYAAVQVAGYVTLPCAGSLTVGYQHIQLDASGKVTAASTGGRGVLVTDVNDGVCGLIL